MSDLTPEEREELQELRARGSQKARSHQVVQQQCPGCGKWMAADLVASIKRGENRCPRPGRWYRVTDILLAELFGGVA